MNTQNQIFTVILTERHFNGSFETSEITGTLAELTQSFSSTLTCGYYQNHRISRNPKTVSELIKSVNKSYDVIGAYGRQVEIK